MMSFGNPDPGHESWRAWHVGDDAAAVIVRTAVDGGVNFFDTADSYAGGASEEVTGTLLPKFFARREDYVLATKVYFPTGPGPFDRGLSRRHIMAAIDASLRQARHRLRGPVPGAPVGLRDPDRRDDGGAA